MASYWKRFSYLKEKTTIPNRSIITTKNGETFVTENGVTRKVDQVGKSAYSTPTIGFRQPSRTYYQEDDDAYYNLYTSRHTRKAPVKKAKKSNKFGFSTELWKNYSYNNWRYNEDDDKELLCKDPINYITPSASDIKVALPAYQKDKIHLVKDLCRFFYFQMIIDKEYIDKKWSEGNMSNALIKRVNILKKLENTYVPGFSPFEKAKAIYYRILDDEARQNKKGRDVGYGANNFEFDRDVFDDNILKAHLKINPFTKNYELDILNKISLVKHFGKEFVISADIGEMRVANAINKRSIRLKEYEDIFYVDLYQKVLPNFKTKFITKDLNVSIPVEIERKKQKVIILLDESGSMQCNEKQKWVSAILAERFRHVIREEAEIYFSYFVYYPSELRFHHIKDEKDVVEFWKNVYNEHPNGGATDMGRIVEAIKTQIKTNRFFNLSDDLSVETPEILIINDGQDNANTEKFGHKVNAISLVDFSSQLKTLCLNSGGRQIRVTGDGELKTYSLDENKQEVEGNIVT